MSAGPSSMAVSTAMIAKVGVAASPSHLARCRAAATQLPRAPAVALTGLVTSFSGLLAKSLLAGSRDLDPFLVGRRTFGVAVVPVPPFVGRRLRIAFRRILPDLLPSQRRDVEVIPGAAHLLVAPALDEIGAEDPVAVAEEHVGPVPLVDAEIRIETVGDGDPWHGPAHPLLQPADIGLGRARSEHQRGVAGIQVRDMGNLVGHHGAAAAGMIGPTEHARLEEGAVDDQL